MERIITKLNSGTLCTYEYIIYQNFLICQCIYFFHRVPITVYMREKNSGTLKIISEYGQEYGKENPIRVLYHGYGHYDALGSSVSSASSKP